MKISEIKINEIKLINLVYKFNLINLAGVYEFVNFGHKPWWYLREKAEKNLEKKLFRKEIIRKKKEKPGVGQKYAINYAKKMRFLMFMH